MLLLVLCGFYCEYFNEFTTKQDSTTNRLISTVLAEKTTYVYCVNNKTIDTLTEPGYLCDSFYQCDSSRCSYNNSVIWGVKTMYYYCENKQYIPKVSSKITQEPCQRHRIRVVYTLVHTIFE